MGTIMPLENAEVLCKWGNAMNVELILEALIINFSKAMRTQVSLEDDRIGIHKGLISR